MALIAKVTWNVATEYNFGYKKNLDRNRKLNYTWFLINYLRCIVGKPYCPPHLIETRRLHKRSLRLPTRRKWAQSGYLCTTPSTAQAGADAGISWS